jgi:hypothetical protein
MNYEQKNLFNYLVENRDELGDHASAIADLMGLDTTITVSATMSITVEVEIEIDAFGDLVASDLAEISPDLDDITLDFGSGIQTTMNDYTIEQITINE